MTFNSNGILHEAIERLQSCDDYLWWNYLLKKDPVYNKIQEAEKKEVIDSSVKCGVEMYNHIINKYGKVTAAEYAEKLGVQIIEEDLNMEFNYIYISCYTSDPPLIKISNTTLDMVYGLITEKGIQSLLPREGLKELAIMHELFHHLEELTPNIYTREKSIEFSILKIFKYKICPVSASEIAAVHFSKLLAGLHYSPIIYEIMLLLVKNKRYTEKLIYDLLKLNGREK